MQEKLKYEIPRNVKAAGLFFKLDLKGWIIFLSISSFFITLAIWGFKFSLWRTVIGFLGVAITYLSLEIDEITGESNLKGALNLFDRFTTKGILTPKWGGNDYEENKKPVQFDYKTK